jgi:hypothetical protein
MSNEYTTPKRWDVTSIIIKDCGFPPAQSLVCLWNGQGKLRAVSVQWTEILNATATTGTECDQSPEAGVWKWIFLQASYADDTVIMSL